MGLNLEFSDGHTPLEEDEKEALLIHAIATRAELDEFEQHNIEEAVQWVFSKSLKPEKIFTGTFLRNLHKRMYDKVWNWAGQFRQTDKNLGISKWQIPTAVKALNDDALFWVKNNTYTPDEIAIYYKHKLVAIHCFPNGNGRHSRLLADIIINKIYNKPLFTWGTNNIVITGDSRSEYLDAVRDADHGDYENLLKFARS